jgi:hypothetical protein
MSNKYLEKIAASFIVEHPDGRVNGSVQLTPKEYDQFVKDHTQYTSDNLGSGALVLGGAGALAGHLAGKTYGHPVAGAILGGVLGLGGYLRGLERDGRSHALNKYYEPTDKYYEPTDKYWAPDIEE